MQHDAFRYDFTGKELIYFLFKKKMCPKCGGKMIKSKGYETVEGRVFNRKADAFFIPNAKVKHYLYFFTCQQCNSEFTLSELSTRRKLG